jgi:hypothetical protein
MNVNDNVMMINCVDDVTDDEDDDIMCVAYATRMMLK